MIVRYVALTVELDSQFVCMFTTCCNRKTMRLNLRSLKSFQKMLHQAVPRGMCVATKLLDKLSWNRVLKVPNFSLEMNHFRGIQNRNKKMSFRYFCDRSRNLTQLNLPEKDTFGVVHDSFHAVKLVEAEQTRSIKFKQEPTVSYRRSPHLSNRAISENNVFFNTAR